MRLVVAHEAWNALLLEEEDIASGRALKIDRQIRDKVRAQLALPPARGGKLASISDWARLNGIEPCTFLRRFIEGTPQAARSEA